jgi:hypothetical protein
VSGSLVRREVSRPNKVQNQGWALKQRFKHPSDVSSRVSWVSTDLLTRSERGHFHLTRDRRPRISTVDARDAILASGSSAGSPQSAKIRETSDQKDGAAYGPERTAHEVGLSPLVSA